MGLGKWGEAGVTVVSQNFILRSATNNTSKLLRQKIEFSTKLIERIFID